MSEVCGREASQHVNTLTMGDPDYPGSPKKSRLCPLPEEPETSAGENGDEHVKLGEDEDEHVQLVEDGGKHTNHHVDNLH